ncbi:MAG: hypothetical protein R3248_04170 [Candidatus Promineifilaceae bacterium]|nr:hypothetical protein [Candidatus Promineifilaceae bacterium]
MIVILLTVSAGSALMAPRAQTIPTISIVSVEADESVTIRTANYPPNRTFTVTMGAMGTRGINGIVVAQTDSGDGGTFEATYNIPDELKGSYQIAIRLQSPGGYYSYNWFYNNTANPGSPSPPVTPPQFTIPTFSIEAVERDSSVTIQTKNFPPNRDFVVTMGPMGTRGINGTVVETINSGDGGSFQATFPVPAGLHGSYRISIRLQATTGGYYAYNWFYNNTTTGGDDGGDDNGDDNGDDDGATGGGDQDMGTVYRGIPTFWIKSVQRDGSVTIETNNFPPNRDFVVTMGPMFTRGINGTVVETINSGDGGSFEATFPVPAGLHGSYRISIRLQATTGGYYAYNWFYNNTTP